MWYKLNINKLFITVLPTFLRKPVITALLRAVAKPMVIIYDSWIYWRGEDLYKLSHNGQVCYLRKALNDNFDPELRRITIASANKFNRNYIYTKPEEKPKFLNTIYLRSKLDYADTGADFIVLIPVDVLKIHTYQIRVLIDYYKEGFKRYKLVEQ